MTDREQTRWDADEQIEKNMRILKLARDEPCWALARILRAEELEAELEQAERRLKEREEWWAEKHLSEQQAANRMVEQAERERDEARRLFHGLLAETAEARLALREACDWLDNDLTHAPDTITSMADADLMRRWREALAAFEEPGVPS